MSLFSGVAIVIPRLLMTLRLTKLTSLLTTSLAVLGVVLVLAALWRTEEPKDVVGATAAS